LTIDQLYLLDFKNYSETTFLFSPNLNVLVGKNGSGKTNLLEAIYFLAFTKSAIASNDQHCIRDGEIQAVIRGKFSIENKEHEVTCGLQAGQKKIFREDGVDYTKLTEHIGKYPVVLVLPDDVDLVKEGSEARRKFFDGIISQLDKNYLEESIQYNHCLKQRNSLLKMFAESGKSDWIMIEAYDDILISLGRKIFEKRKKFLIEFLPAFQKHYQFLVEEEPVDLRYSSVLEKQEFKRGLYESRGKDLALQRTSFGIHRDDYVFTLGTGDLKRLGSQGQQKSFVLALKLAQADSIKNHKGFAPILLLDDVFDKLDSSRIEKLLKVFLTFNQIFLTDARPDRTLHLLESVNLPKIVFRIEKGTATADE
jgi:DNA replication and repair protein RecF